MFSKTQGHFQSPRNKQGPRKQSPRGSKRFKEGSIGSTAFDQALGSKDPHEART